MKKIIYLLLSLTIILSSCTSSKKMLAKGRYDAAMNKAAKKIRKKPSDYKEVDVFTQAYNTANKLDQDKIKTLKLEGNPANYNQIYALYANIKRRQELAKSLPPIGVNFKYEDIDKEMVSYKSKAAQYSYAKGVELLKKNDRQDAREAYADFLKCKSLVSNYKDVDDKIKQAQFLGTANVIFTRKNSSGALLPPKFFDAISTIQLNDLDHQWLNFDTNADTSLYYDYEIQLDIKSIAVSPGKIVEKPFQEKRTVKDGFEYVLDANGNVKKDSLGNDIKKPKYKTLVCNLIDKDKKKIGHVMGELIFKDNRTGQIIKTEKAAADALFEDHSYKVVGGDMAAISDATRQKLDKPEAPFPPDPALLMQASQTLKGICKNLIVKDAPLLK